MPNLTPDRHQRMAKALLCLEGLSLGDAFGQSFFMPEEKARSAIASRRLPDPPWPYTDDTVMAIAVVETLEKFDYIEGDYLAQTLTNKYQQDPHRGYGSTAGRIFRQIGEGISWQQAASSAFDGLGSMGNGAAVRSAPIGAYFFDDYSRVVCEAKAASAVTHAHPDAQAGAIAVAVAAAFCTSHQNTNPQSFELLQTVLEFVPQARYPGYPALGDTKSQIQQALSIPHPANLQFLIRRLGNGMKLCSFDTVAIALWFAAHNLNNFAEALWQAVEVLGDRDTICAIVGSLVCLSAGRPNIPQSWLEYREALPLLGRI